MWQPLFMATPDLEDHVVYHRVLEVVRTLSTLAGT